MVNPGDGKCLPLHSLTRDYGFYQKTVISGEWEKVEYGGPLDCCGIFTADHLKPADFSFFEKIVFDILHRMSWCPCIQIQMSNREISLIL